jgi:hypothetical protein
MRASGYLCATITKKKDGTTKQIANFEHNEVVSVGRDKLHEYAYINTANPGTYGFNYVAISETLLTINGGSSLADTSLPGEISSNGLQRKQAPGVGGTLNHSVGTNSSTVEVVYTASANFTDVKSSALFNTGPSVGPTMGHHANFATGSGTMSSGDTLRITWITNLG